MLNRGRDAPDRQTLDVVDASAADVQTLFEFYLWIRRRRVYAARRTARPWAATSCAAISRPWPSTSPGRLSGRRSERSRGIGTRLLAHSLPQAAAGLGAVSAVAGRRGCLHVDRRRAGTVGAAPTLSASSGAFPGGVCQRRYWGSAVSSWAVACSARRPSAMQLPSRAWRSSRPGVLSSWPAACVKYAVLQGDTRQCLPDQGTSGTRRPPPWSPVQVRLRRPSGRWTVTQGTVSPRRYRQVLRYPARGPPSATGPGDACCCSSAAPSWF